MEASRADNNSNLLFGCLVEQTAQMCLWSTNYFAGCVYYFGPFAFAPYAQITIPDCHIQIKSNQMYLYSPSYIS
jgi:hypothetical protein